MKSKTLALLLLLAPAPAFGQADSCSNATNLGTGSTNVSFDTRLAADTNAPATTSPEQQVANITNDVWFRYTAEWTTVARFSTCNDANFDTAIAVWSGSDCSSMVPMDWNDDGPGSLCAASSSYLVDVPVVAGSTYYIQVGDFRQGATQGSRGVGTLTVTEVPPTCGVLLDDAFEGNDTCAAATPMVAGVYRDLTLTEGDSDFFRVDIPAGQELEFSVVDNPTEMVQLSLYFEGCLFNQDIYNNRIRLITDGTDRTVTLGVHLSSFSPGVGCLEYDLSVDILPDPCYSGMDDTLEDNDTYATAIPLPTGTTEELWVNTADPDFFELTVNPGERVECLVYRSLYLAGVGIRSFESNGNLRPMNASFNLVVYSGAELTAPETVVIEPFNAQARPCTQYTARVTRLPDPCSDLPEDSYEDNDDCTSAKAITNGTYSGLTILPHDGDFFRVTVPAGGTFLAEITAPQADIRLLDAYLWDPLLGCGTDQVGPNGPYVALSVNPFNGLERLTFTNPSPETREFILEIDRGEWDGSCSTYALTIQGAGPLSIGTSYCQANPNSTGQSGIIGARGDAAAAANDVTLWVAGIPPAQFGIFVVSRTPDFVPGGSANSNGNICLGGTIGRFIQSGQVLSSGANGRFELPIDITALPQGGVSAAALPGESWHFQAWHRDGVGLGSNFTEGLRIDFQ